MTQCWILISPDSEHCGIWGQIGNTLGSLLALSVSLFVPLSSPQLCHNIQRTGAHNPGCKHTRGPEVVQQQPRPWDAYELARVWGMTSNLGTRSWEGPPLYLLSVSNLLHLQEYNPDQASAPPKKKKPDGAPPTPSTDHVAPPGDRSRLVHRFPLWQSHGV